MTTDSRLERVRDRRAAILEYGTPVYVFDESSLRRQYRSIRSALDEHYPDSVVHFAVKANYEPGILSVLRSEGCAAEVFASCELAAARRAGFEPERVLVTGQNRDPADLRRAVEWGAGHFLVDNEAELDRLAAVATETGERIRVLVRVNPAMSVPTHPDVATATAESKFGLDIESGRAERVAKRAVRSDGLELAGVQLHIGSQIRGIEPYEVAAEALLEFMAELEATYDCAPDILDLGGGFPIEYDESVPDTADIVAAISGAIEESIARLGFDRPTLFLEPGRRLVGETGTLLGTVGVVKETPHSTFAILDVGTNAVSSHWPYPVVGLSGGEPTETYDVAGPLCYTGDVIQEDVALPPLKPGDVVAIDRVGAYSLGSASHTNAEPKPPVLLLREDGSIDVLRERETCADVLGGSRVPDDLADR